MATAKTEDRYAPLASDFGLDYATRLFGTEALADLPRYQRGQNAGKLKGYLRWRRTLTAGYHVNAGGGVRAGQTVRAWITAGPYGGESDALTGRWLGRVQSLCGSAIYLGEEGRARAAAEQGR